MNTDFHELGERLTASLISNGVGFGQPQKAREIATSFMVDAQRKGADPRNLDGEIILVVAYCEERHRRSPDKVSGALIGAFRDYDVFKDALLAARKWRQSTEAAEADPNSDGHIEIRKPTSVCLYNNCGGHVTDWFDIHVDSKKPEVSIDPLSAALQGRLFCIKCGLEWVWIDNDHCGYRLKEPRFGGHKDPKVGLPLEKYKAEPPKKPKKKLELKGRDVTPTDPEAIEKYWDSVWAKEKAIFSKTKIAEKP